jgi:hypothetical protein
MRSFRIIMALVMSVLAGCVETRFESPPGDNIETCDAHWKGLWSGDKAQPHDTSAFFVDDECHFIVLNQIEKGGPLKQIHVPVNYVHDGGRDYIVVADSMLKGLVEIKPVYGIDPPPAKAFFFARYSAHGDRIELYKVDDARVARLVIDGKLDGTVSKTGSDLHAFVRGDRVRTLEIVRKDSIFVDKADPVLYRIHESVDEYERALIQQQHQAKP